MDIRSVASEILRASQSHLRAIGRASGQHRRAALNRHSYPHCRLLLCQFIDREILDDPPLSRAPGQQSFVEAEWVFRG
jgi:hypothetical protein